MMEVIAEAAGPDIIVRIITLPKSSQVVRCAVTSKGMAGHVASEEVYAVKLPAVRSTIQAFIYIYIFYFCIFVSFFFL